jgi:hypothetical protein
MTTDPVQRLTAHAAARDAWLDATTRQLQGDERIAAVWLVGSLGQGGGDEWSDVDLALVVRDEDLPVLAERRRSVFSRFGEVLVAIDAPNAPAGGAYLGVAYAAGDLPLWVDWYLWPLSTARRPNDARVLIERAALPPPAAEPHAALLQRSQRLTRRRSMTCLLIQSTSPSPWCQLPPSTSHAGSLGRPTSCWASSTVMPPTPWVSASNSRRFAASCSGPSGPGRARLCKREQRYST